MPGFFIYPERTIFEQLIKSIYMKSLDRNAMRSTFGGLKDNGERGTNVEDRRCGRKYGAPPCQDSHDLMK